jgi:hypothetical protein
MKPCVTPPLCEILVIQRGIDSQNDKAPGELLERMADQFELIEYGLSEVRRLWDERDEQGAQGIIL